MKKVFQTIVDKNNGNCMQAAIASLLELKLEQVPNFIEEEHAHVTLYDFMRGYGYDVCTIRRGKRNDATKFLCKIAKFDDGINGYLCASVLSQTFENTTHLVVTDLDLNIVHDPNPNQKAMSLTPDDIESILITKDMVIGKTDKLFTLEEWEKASAEERDLNTWKGDEK